jgi:hypothetical protein
MGAISEILNTLGYGEQFESHSNRIACDDDIQTSDPSLPSTEKSDTPKGYLNNGVCVGCELSARYF